MIGICLRVRMQLQLLLKQTCYLFTNVVQVYKPCTVIMFGRLGSPSTAAIILCLVRMYHYKNLFYDQTNDWFLNGSDSE